MCWLGYKNKQKILVEQQIMRVAIFGLLTVLALSATVRSSHGYWTTAVKKTLAVSDAAWSYCDIKCLYLENYAAAGTDFVVLSFSKSVFTPNFAACYVSSGTANAPMYKLWNTVVKNTWYEQNCGGDTEDYYALTQGASPTYTLLSAEGQGIGAEITY